MATHQTSAGPARVGDLIKEWRGRRRLSQLDLALEAGVSQRHLSFVESGRSSPSRDMVETLSEHLGLPLRERNILLLSAGFAPAFGERKLSDPSMAAARSAVERVLKAHEPNPALAVDRYWRLMMANAMVGPLLGLVEDKSLLEGEVNVLRVSLHPGGLAPFIVNLAHWKAHLLSRLGQQIDVTADPKLMELERELAAYPVPTKKGGMAARDEADGIAIPFELNVGGQFLSFISTTTIFGTPVDVTLSELAVEAFFPANPETAATMQAMAKGRAN
ncbi:MAG: helix-turn-helix transcriptional regulator [Hyphomonadaceae bacterium]|nr:helix-turn-helix transcriptional regulator [Hyphomonadaceae bacterium]